MGLRIDIVTIFPECFGSPLGVSLIGKAAARGDGEFRVHGSGAPSPGVFGET